MALEELPGGFNNTITKLNCYGCRMLTSLPQLLLSLVELQVGRCSSLEQLPALPEGLTRLDAFGCGALTEVSSAC